jgi:tripartite-type tricarboxylate transporter receptor subunit TctC
MRVLIASLLAAVAMLSTVRAAPQSDFYKGRTIYVIVGFTPGGGYDLYARLLAQHLGKHIPGNPTVITQNMPGAGSLKAVNYLYSVAPKDGTVIGTFGREQIVAPLFGQANFDAAKLSWIGSVTKEVSVCVSWDKSPVKSWNDVMTKQFKAGGSAAGADPDNFAKLYKNVFGAKIRLATGFPGTSDITLAMQRGEVDGLCGFSWSTIKSHYGSWLRDKKINILMQAGTERRPDLADVPLASEFAKTAEQRQILDFVLATQITARPFTAPPGIPADRKAILRTAFDETVKDPAFLAGAEKLQIEVDPVSGAEVDKVVAGLYATPKDVVAKAFRALMN